MFSGKDGLEEGCLRGSARKIAICLTLFNFCFIVRKLLRPTYVKRSRKKNNNNGINHPHIAHIYALPTPFTCAHPQSTPPTHNFLVCFAIAPVAYTFFTIFFRFVFLFAFLIHLYGHISLFSFILTFPIMHLSWRHARCGPLKTARASGGSRMP